MRCYNSKFKIDLILLIIGINFFIISCSETKNTVTNKTPLKSILFAQINQDGIKFEIDTAQFKSTVSSSVFSVDSKIQFDKIEVVKQFTIGEEKQPFYYLLLTDFDKKVKTARWLDNVANSLYLNQNVKKKSDNFELLYLTCAGNKNCNPNIFILDKKRSWICGENPSCLKEGEARQGCDIYTTFIEP